MSGAKTPITGAAPARPSFDGSLAIHPDYLERCARSDFAPTAALFSEPDDDDDTDLYDRLDGVAYVSIEGPLLQKGGYYYDGHEAIGRKLKSAARDSSTGVVAMVIKSPGGQVAGMLDESKSAMVALKASGKPVLAFSREMMASAAYTWGCIADRVCTPEMGQVGSVGVYRTVVDTTKSAEEAGVRVAVLSTGTRKLDGNSNVKLTPEAEGRIQALVDSEGGQFFEHVAACRGMTADAVRALDGECFLGADAVKAGLADEVMSWDQFQKTCANAAVEAGKAKRMQQFAVRLGLAATATEGEILVAIDNVRAQAAKSAISEAHASSVETSFKDHLTGWAVETGRATAGEATELKAGVPVESLARIYSSRKPMQALPPEVREPSAPPAAAGANGAAGAVPPALAVILAKGYGEMSNHERQALALHAPSAFAAKRHEWSQATGSRGDVVVAPAYVGVAPPVAAPR
jgi:ClpP class serine protease